MTASEMVLRKAVVASGLDSRQWNTVQAGLRNRAFFSSQVASERVLKAMRDMAAERAAGTLSASDFRRLARQVLSADGYDAGDDRGTIKDLTSKARLDLIQRTNVEQMRGYVRHLESSTPGAFAAAPAQELVRVRDRKAKRDWAARWKAAGGRFFGGRMIALKDDPIWTAISAFGNPFPPFDFNRGMGVRNVRRSEAVALGLVTDAEVREKADRLRDRPAPDFNAGLKVEDPDGNLYGRLRKAFGDQVRRVDGEIVWRQEVLRETLFTDNFKIALGQPSERGLIAKLAAQKPLKDFADALRGKSLTVTQDWRDAKRSDGLTHLSHFYPNQDHPEDIPLVPADMELLPSLWRNPDRVRKLVKDRFEAQLDTFDGGVLVAQIRLIDTKQGKIPQLWTLYKKGARVIQSGHPTLGAAP